VFFVVTIFGILACAIFFLNEAFTLERIAVSPEKMEEPAAPTDVIVDETREAAPEGDFARLDGIPSPAMSDRPILKRPVRPVPSCSLLDLLILATALS
jgi:hypothetical protein